LNQNGPSVVGPEFEAVEAAHLLHDLARRLDALDVDLIERVAEENLRCVQPPVLAVFVAAGCLANETVRQVTRPPL
jgi:hypothetical protein